MLLTLRCTVVDRSVQIDYFTSMARPREFDRDGAVERAMSVFWRKGYAATSTDDLLRAMNIGRQSMYDTFGDKHRLYLEALEKYQRDSVAENIRRLRSTASPLAGIEAFVIGIIASDKSVRERGCMGVGSICEFGNTDTDLVTLRARSGSAQHRALQRQELLFNLCATRPPLRSQA